MGDEIEKQGEGLGSKGIDGAEITLRTQSSELLAGGYKLPETKSANDELITRGVIPGLGIFDGDTRLSSVAGSKSNEQVKTSSEQEQTLQKESAQDNRDSAPSAKDFNKSTTELLDALQSLAKLNSARNSKEIDNANQDIEDKLKDILQNKLGGLSEKELLSLSDKLDKKSWSVIFSDTGKVELQYKYKNPGDYRENKISFRIEPLDNGSRLLTAETPDHPSRYGTTWNEYFTGKPDQLRGRKIQVIQFPKL